MITPQYLFIKINTRTKALMSTLFDGKTERNVYDVQS